MAVADLRMPVHAHRSPGRLHQGSFTNEHFQYIDKPQGKWTKEQHKVDVVRKNPTEG